MIICVLNQKGGVGKTTLSINLAAIAHLQGAKTVVLDMDRQGSAFDWFAARQRGSKLTGLNVVSAPRELSAPKILDLVRGSALAILDGPPRLGDITRSAAVAADLCLIPTRPGSFDWWALEETVKLLESADQIRADRGQPPLKRLYVLNAIVQGTHVARDARQALSGLGDVAACTIHARTSLATSSFFGECVATLDPTGKAATEMTSLYKEIRDAQPTPES